MTRLLLVPVVVALGVGLANGQNPYPVPGPLNYLPYYAPVGNSTIGRPPLSPYLNLLNGTNPALNYYYGVRPLLPPPGTVRQGVQPGFPIPTTGNLFQPVPPARPPYPTPEDPRSFTLPSAGGPVVFGNSFGSSRAGVVGGQSGFFSGAGATSPASSPPASTPSTIPRSR